MKRKSEYKFVDEPLLKGGAPRLVTSGCGCCANYFDLQNEDVISAEDIESLREDLIQSVIILEAELIRRKKPL